MGVNNRQRRKDKQRRRDRQHQQRGSAAGRTYRPPAPEPPHDPVEFAREAVLKAARAAHTGGDVDGALRDALLEISGLLGFPVIDDAFGYWEQQALDAAWNGGWQPADIVRMVRRRRSPAHVRLIVGRVLDSGRQRPEVAADSRWAAQLHALECEAGQARRSRWGLVERLETLGVLLHLPRLPRLIGSTGGRRPSSAKGAATLEKIRALLAKAESTTFPEEAESLTAKAQELMARHAIDEAMLAAAQPGGHSDVVAWRIGIDDPYAQAKATLLSKIAKANGSQAVSSTELGFSTVMGTEANLERVELLFTSLLVQATEAMVRAGRSVDGSGRFRTRSFRQSFLVAYAIRIGERLAEATESVVAEEKARLGDCLLPVLAAGAEAVDDAVRETFPHITFGGLAINNYAGYVAGRSAAELARLGAGEELPAS